MENFFWFLTLALFLASAARAHRAYDNIVLIRVIDEMWEHGNLATTLQGSLKEPKKHAATCC